MSYTIIIPARMASTRLPNKMMQPLKNKPLIEQTWRQACKSNAKRIIIATDHMDIYKHMDDCGAEVVMTHMDHQNGSERLSEVVTTLNLSDNEIILNWQGDEPFLPHASVQKVILALQSAPDAAISTLALPIQSKEDLNNPNIVKVVLDHQGFALYFSRAPIPYPRDQQEEQNNASFRHIGVYAYRASFLKKYSQLPNTKIENIEKLEQLRALFHGFKIITSITNQELPAGIDTLEDLQKANAFGQLNNQ